jgi:hypothetical protein
MIENQIDPLMIVCLFWASYDPPLSYHQHGWNGSTTAIHHTVRVGSGTSHKAAIRKESISASLIVGVGQDLPVEHERKYMPPSHLIEKQVSFVGSC